MAKSNIFAIDIEAAERIIVEANAELVERHDALMSAFDRLPGSLETEDQMRRALVFARQLRDSAAQSRATRLADTKPLRDLVRRVDEFFKKMEKQAVEAQAHVVSMLSRYGRKIETPVHAQATIPSSTSVLVHAGTGEVLGSARPRPPALAEIKQEWVVETLDRSALDLEALRPFLTEAALLHAAKAHLKTHGPHGLPGATYGQKAVID